jgi:hypothetical protein
MIRRMLIATAIAATALVGAVAAPSANASNVHWNVSIGLPGIGVFGGGPGYGYGYVAPAPVYVAPPVPAYYPAPAYYPVPVVVAPRVYGPVYRPYYRPVYHPVYWNHHH